MFWPNEAHKHTGNNPLGHPAGSKPLTGLVTCLPQAQLVSHLLPFAITIHNICTVDGKTSLPFITQLDVYLATDSGSISIKPLTNHHHSVFHGTASK